MNNYKFEYDKEYLSIYDYVEIKYISKEIIAIKDFQVIGENLKVESFDGFILKITGIIKTIKLETNYEQV